MAVQPAQHPQRSLRRGSGLNLRPPGSEEFTNGKPSYHADGLGLISIRQEHGIRACILGLAAWSGGGGGESTA